MTRKFSKRLVIDASVARATGGEEAIFPTSKYCRDFLKMVLIAGHRVVMTAAIKAEWNKHQSRFAQQWLVEMKRQRGRIAEIEPSIHRTMRNAIETEGAAQSEQQRQAMRKDCLLVEAALSTDQRVISLDERVRALFSRLSSHVSDLQMIVWINPAVPEEEPITWLQEGAKHELRRCIRSEQER